MVIFKRKTLVPIIDPYQQQTTIVALRTVFKWDGFTSIAVDLNASASTTLYFYPSEKRKCWKRTIWTSCCESIR